MKLDQKEIDRLAKLAKLELSVSEKKSLETELSDILDFVETLNSISTDEVPATAQVTGLKTITRPDEVNYNFDQSDMLKTMPDVEDGYLKVPAVFKTK